MDAGYVSGPQLAQSQAAGIALVGPRPGPTPRRNSSRSLTSPSTDRRSRPSAPREPPRQRGHPHLSELVRQYGLRRHRYRGAAKRHCENLLTGAAKRHCENLLTGAAKRHCENLLMGAACNLKRLVRALGARWERDAAARALPVGRVPDVAAPPLAA